MSGIVSNNKQAEGGKGERLKRWFIPLLTLLLVIAITIGIFFYRERIAELGNYGYLGAFLVSLTSNASIILPIPGIVILFALGAVFHPAIVGLAGGAGGAIGELTGYLAGFSGRGLAEKSELYDRLVGWLNKWGAMTVFFFALTPLPFDFLGIVAGILRFPLWKFFLACWAGKTIANIIVAYAGLYGWKLVLSYFG